MRGRRARVHGRCSEKCLLLGLNQGPSDLQSDALPTELKRLMRTYIGDWEDRTPPPLPLAHCQRRKRPLGGSNSRPLVYRTNALPLS